MHTGKRGCSGGSHRSGGWPRLGRRRWGSCVHKGPGVYRVGGLLNSEEEEDVRESRVKGVVVLTGSIINSIVRSLETWRVEGWHSMVPSSEKRTKH